MKVEDAVKLPKGHPARFLALYGSHPGTLRARELRRQEGTTARLTARPAAARFRLDLANCAETNS